MSLGNILDDEEIAELEEKIDKKIAPNVGLKKLVYTSRHFKQKCRELQRTIDYLTDRIAALEKDAAIKE
jgi:HPt (histidine-containing phosphotransfer) domain-containing protein